MNTFWLFCVAGVALGVCLLLAMDSEMNLGFLKWLQRFLAGAFAGVSLTCVWLGVWRIAA